MTKILIIEDESSFSEALSFLLQKEGYTTQISDNGKDGLEQFKSQDFDLVLLDLMIPEMSGIEVCRAIRATSQVPIFIVTGKQIGRAHV